jgi:hypothetical protein
MAAPCEVNAPAHAFACEEVFFNAPLVAEKGKGGLWLVVKRNRTGKRLPEIRGEDEERAFWASHDSTECVDWSECGTDAFTIMGPKGLVGQARVAKPADAKDLKSLSGASGWIARML